MKWRKLGKVFDPRDHKLPNDCSEYAQSPQVLVLDDRVRIYFSTRAIDASNGKFLSHVAFVEMTRDFSSILAVSEGTVVPLGGLGAFDEHGIFPINVVQTARGVLGFTTGWSRRVSVSVETGIGLVRSSDGGLTFERDFEGPVLSASGLEPFLVADGFVLPGQGQLHMWYIFGTQWISPGAGGEPERVYKIGHATSTDYVHWVKEEGVRIISDALGDTECQALPTVIQIGDRYHMYFCFRDAFGFRSERGRGYRIGHAWSDDLRNWVRAPELPIVGTEGDWDGEMQCYPHVFRVGDSVFMLYNGDKFGRFGFGLAQLDN